MTYQRGEIPFFYRDVGGCGDTILAKLLPLQQERYFYGEGFDKCHLLLRSRLHTVPGFCCQSWIVAITIFLHGHLDENDFKALE